MQEESTALSENKAASPINVSHQYYEVGREILSKPNLLCDIVESSEAYPVLIFCNTPSDTDFVEIMLKKRGISAQKLIGNVPQDKITRTFEQLKNNELSAIVLTDIAARIIDISDFKLAINYSVPQDADIYFERAGQGRQSSISRAVTLVTPLELANFHFLKKALGVEPELAAAPSADGLLKSRFTNLKKQAIAEGHAAKSEELKSLVSLVLSDSDKEEILALLIHNSLTVLPAAKTAQSKAESFDDEDFDDDAPQQRGGDRWNNNRGGGNRDRGGRGGDNYRGRDRGDRGDRGGDRGERGDRYEDRGDSRGDYDSNRNGRGHGSDDDSGRQNRRRGRSDKPIKKDARIYLGKGSEAGITKEKIVEIISKSSLAEDAIKHLSIRKNYTFFDIDDEKSSEVIENLKVIDADTDAKYSPSKAITINAVSEEDNSENSQQENNSSEENTGSEAGFSEDFVEDDEDQNFGNR